MSWTNADGLTILFNGEKGEVNKTGVTPYTLRKTFTLDVVGTELGASAATPTALDAFIPANAYITAAYIVVDEAFTSGGAATLTVGLYTQAGAAIDADGVDAAVALSAVNAVGKVVKADGALVGGTATVGAADAYIAANYGTAAFTAGKATVVVEYIQAG